MKKRVFSLALIAASLFSATAFAQTQSESDSNGKAAIEKVRGEKGKKQKMGDRKKNRNPYEGLNLTDAQKSKLQQLDEKHSAERKAAAEAMKADKQRNDSAKAVARKNAKKEYLEEVKAIIGPDQYVVFLENFYINGNGGNHSGKAKMMAHRQGKDGKAKMQGNKQGKGKLSAQKGNKSNGKKELKSI